MNNPTESDKIQQSENFIRLNSKQRQAIEMLLMGKTDLEVTEALGIVRDTLWRWRKNPDFIAVWNELSVQIWSDLISRLNHVFSRSVGVIEEAIDKKDVDVALALVQALKGNASKEQGSTAPQLSVLSNLLTCSVQVIEQAIEEKNPDVAIALVQAFKGNVNSLQGNKAPQLVVLKAGEDSGKQSCYQNTSALKDANVNHHHYPAS